MHDVHYSSASNEWATPQALYDALNREFQFTLDPCSTHDNHKCETYYTIEDNGLAKDWAGQSVFMNPPYGREQPAWIRKAYMEGWKPNTTVVCLIPARTDTKVWHDYVMFATEVRFIRGRVKFGDGANSAPFPFAIVVFSQAFEPTRFTTMHLPQS